jgi:hypothetical protein
MWVSQTVDSAGYAWDASLALDGSGNPHISYFSDQDLKYAAWTGSAWMTQTVDSVGDVGLYASLALDGSGNPHISYYDLSNGDLKYAVWTGSAWMIQTVDSTGDVGLYTSLALDGSGAPHISYYDYSNGALKYAYVAEIVRYVASTGSDLSNDCTNSDTPCETIQHAVDQAQPGDEIRVAAGVYSDVQARAGITQVAYISKTVMVRGGYTTTNWSTADFEANPTTLDAQGAGRVLYITGTIAPTVEGVRITGGDATGLGGNPGGSDAGGGVYVYAATATISDCVVYGNTASTAGGGQGGGLYFGFSEAPTVLQGNVIVSNTATLSQTALGEGGGLYVVDIKTFTLTNNMVTDNHANTEGSGLWVGGLTWPSSGYLLHTTIADNHGNGSGVYVGGDHTLAFTNTIIAGHRAGITVTAGGTATLEATLWYSNGADTGGDGTILIGTVNVIGDPAFANPAAWDYHLGPDSAAIDAGVDAGVLTDIDGDLRLGLPDIGADESMWSVSVYLPLVVRSQ